MDTIKSMTPIKISKGKDLENEVKFSLDPEQKAGRCHFNKYGVTASVMGMQYVNPTLPLVDLADDIRQEIQRHVSNLLEQQRRVCCPRGIIMQPNKSLPDFEGVFTGGIQFLFDCKLISATASYQLRNDFKSKNKQRQIDHLLDRGQKGCVSGLLLHFNERVLKTRTDDAQTWWFPCKREHPFWRRFESDEEKMLSRSHCQEYGHRIDWHVPKGCRKPRMRLMETLEQLRSEVI